jgi:hypothetical protein
VLVTGFVAALAVLFLLLRDPIFKVLGVLLIVLVFSGIYAFAKGETWSMSVEKGILTWDYARWPKSSGRVDMSTVRQVVVDDSSSSLLLTFLDGSTRRIKLIGVASQLRDYLVAQCPQVRVEYVEGA